MTPEEADQYLSDRQDEIQAKLDAALAEVLSPVGLATEWVAMVSVTSLDDGGSTMCRMLSPKLMRSHASGLFWEGLNWDQG